MSENCTIARPYAKAIFEYALSNKQLAEWSVILRDLSIAILDPQVSNLIKSSTVAASHIKDLLLCMFQEKNPLLPKISNLVDLLLENKRLLILPDISTQYDILRAEQEKTLVVYVKSYSKLTAQQQQGMINALSKRLKRDVTLEVNIDRSLLGGAIIFADDLVIDGSVRSQLNKLSSALAA